jgi:hypothetical protein
MARQQAAQRPIESRSNRGDSSAGTPTLIRFEPDLAVRAITFHLVDEGITTTVVPETAHATLVRLKRSSIRPTVQHAIWGEMTNPQRLHWLLEQTHTVARLIDDETSVLEPAMRP